jgi:regulation of enolase protein 1 (concanavalin A-like superfamily)
MEKETFDRAIELKERLDGLNEVKKAIEYPQQHRLSYIEEDSEGRWSHIVVWKLKPIGDILDRHDEQIRKEIDEEIQKIYNEIEQL